jgi:conjugal transfer pilus assembly protein TraV
MKGEGRAMSVKGVLRRRALIGCSMRVGVVGVSMLAIAGTGCRALNPYHGEFMCAASADHGKCETVEQAYAEALAGQDGKTGGTSAPAAKGASGPAQTSAEAANAKTSSPELLKTRLAVAQDRYLEAQYQKLAALVQEPVMPIVEPAKVLRTLILSYPSGESLYMPRYVYYFGDEQKFVIGQYLNPLSTPQTVYPNGAP